MIGLVTGGLMAAVWQGVLLAAAVWLVLRLLPRTPAAVRFAIWFAVFLVVTALPLVSLWSHAPGVTQVQSRAAWLTLDPRWSLAIAAVWALASLVRAATLTLAGLRLRALWKRATPVEIPGAANSAIGSRRAQLCTSDEVDRPTVIGFFSPKILIPAWLLEKLTPSELEQIVLHESGHLGRADDWMNLLQKIALVIFPLNPALAWVERRLCFERELAVDERVLRSFAGKAGAATAYAACLTTLAEHRLARRGFALALGVIGRESELGRRIGRILRRGDSMKPLHARLVLGGAMLGLAVGAVGLERCPQVVGFAPTTTQKDASLARGAEQWLPAHGVETATSQTPIVRTKAVQITISTNEIRQTPNASHETFLVARDPSVPQAPQRNESPSEPKQHDRTTSNPVRMVQTMERDSSRRGPSRSISDVTPSRPADGLTQWVVVTSWQGQDGSRMVLTTARSLPKEISDAPPATGDAPELEQHQQRPEQFHPYAAVPVQGGWLVFQL